MNTTEERPVETKELLTHVKKGVTLEELYNKAQGIQNLCEDYTVIEANDRNFMFSAYSGSVIYSHSDNEVQQKKLSGITRFALGQLCTKIGVPVRYIDKCIDSGHLDLAEENISEWLSEFNKDMFIREYSNKIRGILSNKYSVLDAPDILGVLSDTIDNEKYQIKEYLLNPERFHARVIQREKMNIDGEDLFAGMVIDSSDVGRSILTAKFFIYKQVCTNGLVLPQAGGILYEQKHIGINADEFREDFKKSIDIIPDLVARASELIKLQRKDTLRYQSSGKSETEFKDFTNMLKVKTTLPETEVTNVIQLMSDKYGTSSWGLVNAITEVAQKYTLERRLELEKIAGQLLVA